MTTAAAPAPSSSSLPHSRVARRGVAALLVAAAIVISAAGTAFTVHALTNAVSGVEGY